MQREEKEERGDREKDSNKRREEISGRMIRPPLSTACAASTTPATFVAAASKFRPVPPGSAAGGTAAC